MFADLLDLILPNLCRRPPGQDIHHNDQWPAVLAYGEEHEAITELYGYSEREADEDIVQLITELQGGKEISPGGNLQHISRHTPGLVRLLRPIVFTSNWVNRHSLMWSETNLPRVNEIGAYR